MEPVAIATSLLLLQYLFFGILVGRARMRSGVRAPAVTGDPVFERYFRVHQNTLEQLIVVIPAMWLFAFYVHAWTAAALGLVFATGRALYLRDYVRDPAGRGRGFGLGMIACGLLLLGSLGGAAYSMIR